MHIEHIRLVNTPQGVPGDADYALGSGELAAPVEGEVRVQVLALSHDPYLRSAMAGRHLSAAMAPGDVVRGEGLVRELDGHHRAGRLHFRENISLGLASAPVAFLPFDARRKSRQGSGLAELTFDMTKSKS